MNFGKPIETGRLRTNRPHVFKNILRNQALRLEIQKFANNAVFLKDERIFGRSFAVSVSLEFGSIGQEGLHFANVLGTVYDPNAYNLN